MSDIDKLTEEAIHKALNQEWEQAITINKKLIRLEKDNIPALNRLAFAYIKSRNLEKAEQTYSKVLKYDRYNPIALKNLKWLTKVDDKDIDQSRSETSSNPSTFLEDPGKTRAIILVNCASSKILCNVNIAQQVIMVPKKRSIDIRNHRGEYIGALPHDISHRLLRLVNGGNNYKCHVKNVSKNTVTVFIREILRVEVFNNFPSFPI